MSWNRTKTAVAVSTILFVFATCLLRADDKLTQHNSADDGATLRDKSVPISTERPLRLDVPLVLVNVSAIDPKDRVVTGLRKEDFAVYEDGQPQRVSSLSNDDVPISVGLVFDDSGSMADSMNSARMAVVEFFRRANPDDEFFLISFNDRPYRLTDFTNDTSMLMSRLNASKGNGQTALLDAIYMGLEEMHRAKYSRKALMIISDGGDNHSRYSEGDIKRVVRESDVQIYALDIHRGPRIKSELSGPQLLTKLSGMTGGRHFTIGHSNDLPAATSEIGEEMRNVYTLGYTPGNEKRDGKWHKIQVKLVPRRASPSVRLFAKSGYYAFQP